VNLRRAPSRAECESFDAGGPKIAESVDGQRRLKERFSVVAIANKRAARTPSDPGGHSWDVSGMGADLELYEC
jgi:hypothetical protein